MVNVYVSLDKLGQKLASVGLLSHPQELRAFAQAFNVNQPLFSIIDVGYGKERADYKIKGKQTSAVTTCDLTSLRNDSDVQLQPHLSAHRLRGLS